MSWYNPLSWGNESASTKQQRGDLITQGAEANAFANKGSWDYWGLGDEANAQRAQLQRYANGQDSISAEQLRQGLGQQLAMQRSAAAGAAPQNAVMAARTAANNMNRSAYGMAGQQALAGLQERQQAQMALNEMLMKQRQQELEAVLGGRQQSINAYGGYKPEGSAIDKWGSAVQGGLSALT